MWAWAGRMPSVLMLSPTRVMTWPEIVGIIGARVGIGLIFGPRRISSLLPSSAGGMIILSSMAYADGRRILAGASVISRGSMTLPAMAAAAQVTGLARYTLMPGAPQRPSKLRL